MKKKKLSIDDVLIAVREKCMDCSGRDRKEVEQCRIKKCSLYPYRNVNALRDDVTDENQISMFDKEVSS